MSPNLSARSVVVLGDEPAVPAHLAAAGEVPWHVSPVLRTSGLFERSADAEAMFAGEEEEFWPWAEIMVPVEALPSRQQVEAAVGGTDADDLARLAAVEAWIDLQHGGSIESALEESPLVLAKSAPRILDVVDGWHRLLIVHRRGSSAVRSVVVYAPGCT